MKIDKEKIKEYISNILEIGGSVSFNYKGGMRDWYSTAEIHKLHDIYENNEIIYTLRGTPHYNNFKDKNDAIDKFVDHVFNENNLAIIIERLKIKLNIVDFEEMGYDFERPSKEFLKLIRDEQKLYKEENQ